MMDFDEKPSVDMVWDHFFDLVFNNAPGLVIASPFSYFFSFFKIFIYLIAGDDATPRGVYNTPKLWRSLMKSRNTEAGGWMDDQDDDF
jgi:hypothetical protein